MSAAKNPDGLGAVPSDVPLRLGFAANVAWPDGSMSASGLCRQCIVPRLLTLAQTSAYCGVSARTLLAHCPIRPVSLGPGKRLERYDIRAIDNWIDTLGGHGTSSSRDWLTVLERENAVVRVKGVKRYRVKGRWYAYHRKTGIRLKEEFGTGEFFAELATVERKQKTQAALPGTLGQLFGSYRASLAFTDLALSTRQGYGRIINLLQRLNNMPLIELTPQFIAGL